MTNNNKQSSVMQGRIKRFGRTARILFTRLFAGLYKLGGWRLLNAGNNKVLLITTTGRKSGKQFTTPIGYIKDSQYLYALTRVDKGSVANWFRNAQANGKIAVQIETKRHAAQAEAIIEPAKILPVMQLWAQVNPAYFRFLGFNIKGRTKLEDSEIATASERVGIMRIKLVG